MIDYSLKEVSNIHKIAFATVNYNNSQELFEELKKNKIKLNQLAEFTNEKRKVEWMTIRYLLLQIHNELDDIIYDAHGKPHFKKSSSHLSISHSHNMVAVSIHEKEVCGIDIQLISDKIIRIKQKFLNSTEQSVTKNDPEQLTIYWSCKEALFKIYGKKDAYLKENMSVSEIQFNGASGIANGYIHINQHQSHHKIELLKLENYMMAYVVNS
ncbi:MAG: 4'-phosphopantetheinyl transferase superfamily protein [Vicingaceae bacterium]